MAMAAAGAHYCPPLPILLISLLGLFSLIKISINLINFFYAAFLRRPKPLNSYGSWALVTGATDGIGNAFARRLARRGLHLILVSRNPAKLRSVAAQIRSDFPNTKIKIVAVDFSDADHLSEGIAAIRAAVEGLDVGVLINNVGVTYPAAMFFHEVDERVWMEVVRVNLEATTRVTGAVIQGMIRRKRGAVVCIGSGAAIVVPSHPLFSVYAATKAYVDQLCRSLFVEYKKFGIDVQCQIPLYVATKMVKKVANIEKASLFVPTAEEYARAAVGRIGYEPRVAPHRLHQLQWWSASLIPQPLLDSWRLSIALRRRTGTGTGTGIASLCHKYCDCHKSKSY